MDSQVTLKRTFFRTFAIFMVFLVLAHIYKSYFKVKAGITLFALLKQDDIGNYLTTGLLLELSFFALVIITIHILWSYIITVSCRPFFAQYRSDNHRSLFWFILILLHVNLALLANSYFYPTSLLSIYRLSILNQPLVIVALGIIALYFYLQGLRHNNQSMKIIISLLCLGYLLVPPKYDLPVYENIEDDKPNIILIGLDALRPDHLFSKNDKDNSLPSLNSFLEKSTVYGNSYTPLPRTFVAWLSLLKSQYPNIHKGRFNISQPAIIDKSLPFIDALKKAGYNTTYAIDERRFNQIDKDYGFDHVIGPKIGFADQLTNKESDIPIVNLLSHTRIGQYLFPYIFINRANGKTFDPMLFNDLALSALSAENPNFLAVHFCMLHWPYTSKDFIDINANEWHGNYNYYMYQSLLSKLDQQFDHLINQLKEKNYLDNAIVYTFSDHGEGFQLAKDKLGSVDNKQAELNVNSWGHATNVLDQNQAKVLLSVSRFKNGQQINEPNHMKGVFSLIDIVPTISNSINLPVHALYQGNILPEAVNEINNERFVFVVSSVPSKTLNTSFIDEQKMLSENKNRYHVDNKGWMYLIPEGYHDFIPKQHRSVYYQDWQLAYLPEKASFVWVNVEENSWQYINDFHEATPKKMLSAFCQHYLQGNPDLGIKECANLNIKNTAGSAP